MLVRTTNQHWELLKWAAIISLAALLSLLFASAVGASGRPETPPGLLPDKIAEWARPMGENLDSPVGTGVVPPPAAADVVARVWEILDLHRIGKAEDALTRWGELSLAGPADLWRKIAVGHANLALDRLDAAEATLAEVLKEEPNHAVAHYVRGLLRMRQAVLAEEWPDFIEPRTTRLVATVPPLVVPNTRGMYELAATMEFEKAIRGAGEVRFDAALLPTDSATAMALEPTVGDLLFALNANRFEFQAHLALGGLFLDRGAPELAEEHLDAAAHAGLLVLDEYRELGDEYRDRGQHPDALRAYLKGAAFGEHKVQGLLEALRSLRDSFTNP